MRFYKKIFFICFTFLCLACSKDDTTKDNPAPEETIMEGGDIYTSQLVEVELNQAISLDTYTAFINETPITLIKLGYNKVGFFVNDDLSLGEITMELPDFNTKIRYTIKNTELQQTVAETLDEFTTNFINFKNSFPFNTDTPQDQEAIAAIDDFNEGVEQLNEADKAKLALFYQANKELINHLLSIDYLAPLENARPTGNNYIDELISGMNERQLYTALLGSIFTFGESVWLGYGSITLGQPIAVAAFATVAFTAYVTTSKLMNEINTRKLKAVNINLNGGSSDLNRTLDNTISFNSEENTSLSFNISTRSINASDNSNPTSFISGIFEAYDSLNALIDKINEVVAWVNENTWLSLSQKANVGPTETQPSLEPTSQENFEGLSFSVSDSNLSIQSVAFNEGAIVMKIKINNPQGMEEGEFIETTLNYTYNDEINNFSGNFPIKVYAEGNAIDLSGNWIMEVSNPCEFGSLDGDPALYRFTFNQNSISFNLVTVISDGYTENGDFLNANLTTNEFSLNGDNLAINLTWNWNTSPAEDCEDVEAGTTLFFEDNVSIATTYNPVTEQFNGTMSNSGTSNIITACFDNYPYNCTKNIQIYREE